MKVQRLKSSGIIPREIKGIKAIEENLPNEWIGYCSLELVDRVQGNREIDLVVVTHDRIIIADLKDLNGTLTCQGDIWFKNGKRFDRSPVHKIKENARVLATRLKEKLPPDMITPWVEGRVVLTGSSRRDTLPEGERDSVHYLDEFIRIGDASAYQRLFPYRCAFARLSPFNTQRQVFNGFFSARNFKPQEQTYGSDSYKAIGSHITERPGGLFREYRAQKATDSNYRALLRVWDLDQLPIEFCTDDERTKAVTREGKVLGLVADRNPDLEREGAFLPLMASEDPEEVTTNYWELFKLTKGKERLDELVNRRRKELTPELRIGLISVLLSHFAELHRVGVAHRDVGDHNIWVELPTRIALSGFYAARLPDAETVGSVREHLLACRHKLPEDELGGDTDPFRQDVFLLGVAAHTIAYGVPPQSADGLSEWRSGLTDGIGEAFDGWFAKALSWSPHERFQDAVEALNAFQDLGSLRQGSNWKPDSLARFKTATIPYAVHPPAVEVSNGRAHVYISGPAEDRKLVKVWLPAVTGTETTNGPAILAFLEDAEALARRPFDGVAEILDYGLSPVGLFIIQRHYDLPTLEAHGPFAEMGAAKQFSLALCRLLESLHERGIAHGDLKPANLLVREGENGPHPVLIDLPDFAGPGGGELFNSAYSPSNAASLPREARDRHGAAVIAAEALASVFNGVCTAAAERIRELLKAPGGVSLAELCGILEVEPTQARTGAEDAVPNRFVVRTHRVVEETAILPDNGRLFVTVEPSRWDNADDKVTLTGFDAAIDLHWNRARGCIVNFTLRDVAPETLRWIVRRAKTLEAEIVLAPARSNDASELTEVVKGFVEPGRQEEHDTSPGDSERTGESGYGVEAAGDDGLDVDALWRAMIRAEENLYPEVTVSGDAEFSRAKRCHLMPFEGEIDFDADSRVFVHQIGKDGVPRKVGDLLVDETTKRTLAVRVSQRSASFRPGDRLQLQDKRQRDSLNRRRRAVDRILGGDGEIPDLVDFFYPASSPDATEHGGAPDQEWLKNTYGLNDEQAAAFRHIWSNGPLGLLQGPPGTGKTRFISAFVHYALTEGGARNVLVTSQGHEAVNNAAERVLNIFSKEGAAIDLVRIGQESYVSERLKPYHTEAVQLSYRDLFKANFRSRVLGGGRNLGLPTAFIEEVVEIEAEVGMMARNIAMLEEDLRVDDALDEDILRRRLSALKEALAATLRDRHGIEEVLAPDEASAVLYHRAAARHGVRNDDAVRRLGELCRLSVEWIETLGSKRRNFEEFLARTRSIVCGTCVGVGRPRLKIESVAFDWVIIDEAARCNPGELAVAMQAGRRILLVGDHLQLPPMLDKDLVSSVAAELGVTEEVVERSDFERAFSSPFGQANGRTLLTQYRMAPAIGRLVSNCFYGGALQTGAERGDPPELYGKLSAPLDAHVLWIDTVDQGSSANDVPEGEDSKSRVNTAEAYAVLHALHLLSSNEEFLEVLKASAKPDEPPIGVICTYAGQVRLLRDLFSRRGWPAGFREMVRMGSVDSYQGKENQIVILSLVRARSFTDFSTSPRRLNVSLSRAMERLVVVGSSGLWDRDEEENPMRQVLSHIRADEARGGKSRVIGSTEFMGGK